ncbi:hypothetical protein Tco_1070562 [Tanacetum coccineum]|uniref:Uncharacterized protein n=1 Tax=Tanacetum coccineum TaxID=301880 RepID=A0ABQ5HNP6_9ASTR
MVWHTIGTGCFQLQAEQLNGSRLQMRDDEPRNRSTLQFMRDSESLTLKNPSATEHPLELNKQNEFEKYKAFNDRTIDYEILQTKLNETLGLLALKDIEIKECLKTKAYEISFLNQKHDELVKNSLLTKLQLEGYLKENTKVISDLKVKEDKHIDKMIEMDKQYLKKAQSEKPCLYEIPFDTSNPANKFSPNREETMTLDNESRSKLDKDTVKPYDYTKQNSLYEIFKEPSLEYLYQLERAKEVRKTM